MHNLISRECVRKGYAGLGLTEACKLKTVSSRRFFRLEIG